MSKINAGVVTAEVVEEHVPEIQWPERALIVYEGKAFKCHTYGPDIDLMTKWARDGGVPFRILKVTAPQPPKRQRVKIDWDKVKSEIVVAPTIGMVPSWSEIEQAVERHASIV